VVISMGKHHGSDLKMCSCRQCRYSRRTKGGDKDMLAVRRAGRRRVKQAIHSGQFDRIPEKVWVPYNG